MSTSDLALIRPDLKLGIEAASAPTQTREQSKSAAVPGRARYYSELIAAAFQLAPGERSKVVAFTSATPSAGVSFVTSSLASEIADDAHGRVLLISFGVLDALRIVPVARIQTIFETHRSGKVAVLTDKSSLALLNHSNAVEERSIATVVQLLRAEFAQIIVDVPSFATSEDALRCAGAVDSVVVVVDAGTRRTESIRIACRRLASAGGRVAGLVCNKRRYAIPDWLYKRL
jgi:Mrp family chromosome partitioning ATPase